MDGASGSEMPGMPGGDDDGQSFLEKLNSFNPADIFDDWAARVEDSIRDDTWAKNLAHRAGDLIMGLFEGDDDKNGPPPDGRIDPDIFPPQE